MVVFVFNQTLASVYGHGSAKEEGRCQKVTGTNKVANHPHATKHTRLRFRQRTVYETSRTQLGDCHLFLDQQLSSGTLSHHMLGIIFPCT